MLIASLGLYFITLWQLSVANANDPEEVPLKFIWNIKTVGRYGCEEKYGVPIDVARYGILVNAKNGWRGDVITILYQDSGKWPFKYDNGTEKDGVLPQLGDLDAHLAKMQLDIINAIRDPDFSGQGVLDFEEWFAIWDMNFRGNNEEQYKTRSIELAEQTYPGLTSDEIKAKAEEDYNQAARQYFEETLKLAKTLRPKATWGYYIYPKCYNKKWQKLCHDNAQGYIKQLEWLAKESSAMYPSGYIFKNTPDSTRPAKVHGAVEITRQMLDNIGEPHKPIYLYTRFNEVDYPVPHPYFNDYDLIASLGMAADLGVNGIIMWGNARHAANQTQCETERNYLETKLGPYVQKLLAFFNDCSKDICSSNGRCVKTEVNDDPDQAGDNLETDHVYSIEYVRDSYHCSCYKDWTGDDCSQSQ